MGKRMPLGDDTAGEARMRRGVAPDAEKGRARALRPERIEHTVSRARYRPIIEGERHFLFAERERLRIALQADLQPAGCGDGQCPPRPERGPRLRRQQQARRAKPGGNHVAAAQDAGGLGKAGPRFHCGAVSRCFGASGLPQGVAEGKQDAGESAYSSPAAQRRNMRGGIMSDVMDSPPAEPELSLRDEDGEIVRAFVERVSEAVLLSDQTALRALTGDLHEADLGDLIEALDADDRPRLIALLGKDFDFSALTEVDDAIREEILDEMEPEAVAEGVRDLDSDDAVYILEDLDEAEKAEVLAKLPASERIALQKSLDYPEDSAGRRMQTEVIAVPSFWTVGQTIDFMRDTSDLPDRFYELYVVDPGHHFLGAVPLDSLLRTKRPVKIEKLMEAERRTIDATEPLEEVALAFQRYNLVAAPVVDEAQRLVGVMTIDDVVDVIGDQADDEVKALGGVKGEEELSDSVGVVAQSRFRWLFVNLLTAFLAAAVMKLFEQGWRRWWRLPCSPDCCQPGRQCRNADHDSRGARARHPRTGADEPAPLLHPRIAGRAGERACLRGDHRRHGRALVQQSGAWRRHWPRYGRQSGGGCAGGRRHPCHSRQDEYRSGRILRTFVTTVTDVVGFFAFLGIATLWFGL